MNKAIVFLSILMACSSMRGMEKAPSTPVKSQSSPYVDLFNYIHSAITGTSDSARFTEDMITPEMKEATPENLFLSIKQQLYNEIDAHFMAKGIDKETIDRLVPSIRKSIDEAVESYKPCSPLKSPFKQEFQSILQESPCPDLILRHCKTDKVAFSLGNLIAIDAQKLPILAPSPLSRQLIYKHERSHTHNHDSAIRMAVEAALKEQGKELSPHSKDFLTRTQEVIADLGPMSESHESAAAGVRVMARMVKACGPGTAAEHPAHRDRLGYSKAMSAIVREAHARKRANAENIQPDAVNATPASPIKVAKARKRLLYDEEQPDGLSAKRGNFSKPSEG